MSNDYPPRTDAEPMVFASTFAAKTTAAPMTYGLVANDAVQITEAADDFAARYAAASDPATRTEAAITAKDAADRQRRRRTRPGGPGLGLCGLDLPHDPERLASVRGPACCLLAAANPRWRSLFP